MTISAPVITLASPKSGAMTKTELGYDFPPDAYAYVGDPSDPTTWKLRLWETTTAKLTAAQVSRSIAALGASYLGSKVEIPAADLPNVKLKIMGAWLATHAGRSETDAPGILRCSSPVAEFAKIADMPPLMKDVNGNFHVLGLSVFKTGPAKDSLGRPFDFTSAQLDELVSNFHALKDSGVFPNVPGRSDHSGSIEQVVAYCDNLYTDGTLLFVDIGFTQPLAVSQYGNGTYRARSAEIGPFETNAGETYYPVFLGFAFVDIPAVEGLYSKQPVHGEPITPEATPVAKFTINGIETEDAPAIQAHIDTLQAKVAAPVVLHKFKVAGADTTDVVAVQARIDTLETSLVETANVARAAFVKSLGDNKLIGAPQVASFTTLVASLDDEQFEAFKLSYADAAPLTVLTRHAATGNGGKVNSGGTDPVADRIEVLETVVKMNKRAGMNDVEAAAQPSGIELATLKAQRAA